MEVCKFAEKCKEKGMFGDNCTEDIVCGLKKTYEKYEKEKCK